MEDTLIVIRLGKIVGKSGEGKGIVSSGKSVCAIEVH